MNSSIVSNSISDMNKKPGSHIAFENHVFALICLAVKDQISTETATEGILNALKIHIDASKSFHTLVENR